MFYDLSHIRAQPVLVSMHNILGILGRFFRGTADLKLAGHGHYSNLEVVFYPRYLHPGTAVFAE